MKSADPIYCNCMHSDCTTYCPCACHKENEKPARERMERIHEEVMEAYDFFFDAVKAQLPIRKLEITALLLDVRGYQKISDFLLAHKYYAAPGRADVLEYMGIE